MASPTPRWMQCRLLNDLPRATTGARTRASRATYRAERRGGLHLERCTFQLHGQRLWNCRTTKGVQWHCPGGFTATPSGLTCRPEADALKCWSHASEVGDELRWTLTNATSSPSSSRSQKAVKQITKSFVVLRPSQTSWDNIAHDLVGSLLCPVRPWTNRADLPAALSDPTTQSKMS